MTPVVIAAVTVVVASAMPVAAVAVVAGMPVAFITTISLSPAGVVVPALATLRRQVVTSVAGICQAPLAAGDATSPGNGICTQAGALGGGVPGRMHRRLRCTEPPPLGLPLHLVGVDAH